MSGMITTCVRGRTIDRSADKKIYGTCERHGRVDTRVIVRIFAEGVRGCGSSAGASRLSLPQAMCVLLCALARACVN